MKSENKRKRGEKLYINLTNTYHDTLITHRDLSIDMKNTFPCNSITFQQKLYNERYLMQYILYVKFEINKKDDCDF